MATTPHSSWNLSNMRFECPLVSGPERRDVPGTQRIASLPDFHSLPNCNADHRSLDAMLLGDRRHVLGVSGGKQYARRRFVEGQDLGAQVAIEIDLRADFGGAEATLGACHGETAIAEIVGGFGESRGDDFA